MVTKAFELPILFDQLKALLVHRYPFLLLDRITDLQIGQSIQGYKLVSGNEEFFNGHFPGQAIMPGVLIVEALAQLASVFGVLTYDSAQQRSLYLLAGVDDVRFRQPVIPGDRLDLQVCLLNERRGLFRVQGTAEVAGKPVCSAIILCAKQKAAV